MRLGEALVRTGHIAEAQLEKALNAQLIYGGHLGTCLIELGYVDEETLGNLLSQVYNVRYAHRGLLDDIPPQVLSLLTQTAVEKHMAIPFDLVKNTLHVAMVNPSHVPSLDELYFVSAHRIEAWVSPEVRVFQAMERYYQVQRRVRYIALVRNLDEQKKKGRSAGNVAAVATQAIGGNVAVPLPRLAPIEAPAMSNDPVPAVETPAARTPPPAAGNDLDARLARATEELCRVEDISPAIRVVLEHVARDAARCVFFGVRENEAFVRDVRGFSLDPVTAHKIRFAVTTEPLLTLLAGDPSYRGPVPREDKYRRFFEALKTEIPAEILVLPVHRQDRLTAVLYADGGIEGRIEGETESFLRVMRKFTLALDLIESRQRLRTA